MNRFNLFKKIAGQVLAVSLLLAAYQNCGNGFQVGAVFNESTATSTAPTTVTTPTPPAETENPPRGPKKLAMNGRNVCAIMEDSRVRCWDIIPSPDVSIFGAGYNLNFLGQGTDIHGVNVGLFVLNDQNQLFYWDERRDPRGPVTDIASYVRPVLAPGLTGKRVFAMAGGAQLVATTDGRIRPFSTTFLEQYVNIVDVQDVTPGWGSGRGHMLSTQGRVYISISTNPTPILENVVDIEEGPPLDSTMGFGSLWALLADGRVMVTRIPDYPDRDSTPTYEPFVEFARVEGAKAMKIVSGTSICFLFADGIVRCGTRTAGGQVGPLTVMLNQETVRMIESNSSSYCALTTAGKIKCWRPTAGSPAIAELQ